jgi:hypothetical protein
MVGFAHTPAAPNANAIVDANTVFFKVVPLKVAS